MSLIIPASQSLTTLSRQGWPVIGLTSTDMARLALEPLVERLLYTYGLGTETMPEELLNWTDWDTLWGGDAACDTVCPVSC
jgi:hypothetical protein